MTTVIKIDGHYLESMDFEFAGGRGHATFTDDPARALKFKNTVEALGFYNRTSETVPYRPDGHPNRPLTGFAYMEITEL